MDIDVNADFLGDDVDNVRSPVPMQQSSNEDSMFGGSLSFRSYVLD